MKPSSDDSTRPGGFLRHFQRITTSGNFIPEIDGLRFIAIFSVFMFHLAIGLAIKAPAAFSPPHGSFVGAMAWNGFRGVELFFVISGFILGMPFAAHALRNGRPVDLKQYFLRRLTRLEPPYVLCMVALFALHVLVKHRDAAQLWPHLGASLVYLHDLIYATESPINNVAWSLEIEVQFYILAPFFAALFLIRDKTLRRSTIAALCAISTAAAWFFIAPGQRAYLSILRFAHFFLLGFLLADIYLVDWDGKPRKSRGWDLVSLLGWPLLFLFLSGAGQPGAGQVPGREPALTTFAFPLAVFLLYISAFQGAFFNRLIVNPWITVIGGMCYTIYLLHNPVLSAVLGTTAKIPHSGVYAVDLLVQLACVTPLLLAPSALYFLLIEKPCMRRDWPKRLARAIRLPRPEPEING